MHSRSRSLLVVLVFLLSFAPAFAAAAKAAPAENSSNSIKLTATTTKNVSDCIHVEAVLLAEKLAAMQFGGFVGKHYAVVKTTVSNKCDNQQFILHDIYFDYRDWALSGVLNKQDTQTTAKASGTQKDPAAATKDTAASARDANTVAKKTNRQAAGKQQDDNGTASTESGKVATVGALDVEVQDEADAVWSVRNSMIKGLTLAGQVATGYAFLVSGEASKGINAYNSAFVQNLTNAWPDRRIDQEKNILSFGYRTDRTTAVAKDDHGSYYAFFPLETFLYPTLNKLFLRDPAIFLSSPEALLNAWLQPVSKSRTNKDLQPVIDMLLDLADAVDRRAANITGYQPPPVDIETDPKRKIANLLTDIGSPLEEVCDAAETEPSPHNKYLCLKYRGEKNLFQHASLNSVKIAVRGIMTVATNAVPPIIDKVVFDNEKTGAALWTLSTPSDGTPVASPPGCTLTDAPKTLTATVTGKFLTAGTPAITSITLADGTTADTDCYIGKIIADPLKSGDGSIPFSVQLLQTLESGAKLSFQVTRTVDPSDEPGGGDSGSANKQLTSSTYDYTLQFEPGAPQLTAVAIDKDTDPASWKPGATLTGEVTGTNLTGATLTATALPPDGKSVTLSPTTTTSSPAKLTFSLTLPAQAIPAGSQLTFIANHASATGAKLTSNSSRYSVPKTATTPTTSSNSTSKITTRKPAAPKPKHQ
ncbi:hypothetical protein [Granulicella sibirica]|uniref:Uncharacterized protein n=1 Tax=Granulicella sibirica TaxID=2479048 RepID=A0A4Q0SXU5_9BACT|nr:hypothetical protein [Granulicella sibirica]RXH54239.1 hypothetical protein GRAN_4890 [Granulicella sibirica]